MGLEFIIQFNFCIFIILSVFYFYQIIYVFISLWGEKRKNKLVSDAKVLHRYGVIVAARNESAVIPQLIQSIHNQNYPKELIDIFVVADNCTDSTAQVSRDAGAFVYERNNKNEIGKGYALDFIFQKIHAHHAHYDGYFIFDADNVLDENYILEMNKVFDNGYRVVTSYRNSKNYGTNWISAGYSLWFLREAKFLNNARMMVQTSCAVSGTGFLLTSDIVRKNNGWKYHLLTEDIQFSIDCALKGEVIGYCESAKIYDEQPVTFQQSWTQRLRWSKGFYQVMYHYGGKLLHSIFKQGSNAFSCYDMFMTIAPATIVSLFCIAVNGALLLNALFSFHTIYYMNQAIPLATQAIALSFVNCYLVLFIMGLLTTITEWKQINCSAPKKILYMFTFPIFILTYIPISIVALFKKVEWKPIVHTIAKSVDEVR